MSNYPPGTSAGDPTAPWNQVAPPCTCDECDFQEDESEPDTTCPECESGTMREDDNEPDWDSMPGGADDY